MVRIVAVPEGRSKKENRGNGFWFRGAKECACAPAADRSAPREKRSRAMILSIRPDSR
jgi:hypothetical protein